MNVTWDVGRPMARETKFVDEFEMKIVNLKQIITLCYKINCCRACLQEKYQENCAKSSQEQKL